MVHLPCDLHLQLHAALDVVRGRPLLVLGEGSGARDGRSWPGAYLGGRAHGYLLLLACDGDLAWQLAALRRLPCWNSTARFLVALAAPTTPTSLPAVRAVFKALHAVFADNAVLVVPSGGQDADLYAMDPFRDQSAVCGQGSLGVTLVARWRGGRGGSGGGRLQLLSGQDLFSTAAAPRMAGCRLRVATNKGNARGFARRVAEETVAPLGVVDDIFTSNSSHTELDLSGEWSGMLGDLQRGDADLSLVLIPTAERSKVGGTDLWVPSSNPVVGIVFFFSLPEWDSALTTMWYIPAGLPAHDPGGVDAGAGVDAVPGHIGSAEDGAAAPVQTPRRAAAAHAGLRRLPRLRDAQPQRRSSPTECASATHPRQPALWLLAGAVRGQ